MISADMADISGKFTINSSHHPDPSSKFVFEMVHN
jgi:hypothetical protein